MLDRRLCRIRFRPKSACSAGGARANPTRRPWQLLHCPRRAGSVGLVPERQRERLVFGELRAEAAERNRSGSTKLCSGRATREPGRGDDSFLELRRIHAFGLRRIRVFAEVARVLRSSFLVTPAHAGTQHPQLLVLTYWRRCAPSISTRLSPRMRVDDSFWFFCCHSRAPVRTQAAPGP